MGVLPEYLTQDSILDEQEFKQAEEEIHIDLPVWEGIQNQGEEAWLAIPPKRRRQILDAALTESLTVSTKADCPIEKQKEKEIEEALQP